MDETYSILRHPLACRFEGPLPPPSMRVNTTEIGLSEILSNMDKEKVSSRSN